MIQKTIRKLHRSDLTPQLDLEYWLLKMPEERLEAVDRLRSEYHGESARHKGLLELFNAHRVEYMIVGGYALAFHGVPRFTGDMDLFVKPSSDNAARVLSALADFGFGALDLTLTDFTTADHVVQLGVPPVRIDLLTSISGISWKDAQAGTVRGAYGGVPVDFIGRAQFVANKRAAGRRRDLADLEALGED